MKNEEEEKENTVEEQEKEETTEELKARLAKVEQERDNYKKGLLSRENKIKELKEKNLPEKEVEDEKNLDNESVEKTVTSVLEKTYEKEAITEFLESNSSITDEEWEKIILNYNPVHGKSSKKSIAKDLERAYVLYKYDSGETISPEEIKKQMAQSDIKRMASTSGAVFSGKYEEGKKGASDSQISLANKMRVDVKKLEAEDDSLIAEINLTK